MFEKQYHFNPSDFNKPDYSGKERLFWDYLEECASDFNAQFQPLYANVFYGNSRTLLEFNKCLPQNDKSQFGFEKFEGNIEKDLDINIEIDRYSQYSRIYAIQVAYHAVYIVVNDKLLDNLFWLRHNFDKNDEEKDYDPVLNEMDIYI